jgi:hypothetical protein
MMCPTWRFQPFFNPQVESTSLNTYQVYLPRVNTSFKTDPMCGDTQEEGNQVDLCLHRVAHDVHDFDHFEGRI